MNLETHLFEHQNITKGQGHTDCVGLQTQPNSDFAYVCHAEFSPTWVLHSCECRLLLILFGIYYNANFSRTEREQQKERSFPITS